MVAWYDLSLLCYWILAGDLRERLWLLASDALAQQLQMMAFGRTDVSARLRTMLRLEINSRTVFLSIGSSACP